MNLRLQGPEGVTTLELSDGASFGDLIDAAAAACSLPASQVELRSGFPPQPLAGDRAAAASSFVGAGARLVVSKARAAPTQAHNPHGSGGRKKAAPQRLAEGAAPRDRLLASSSSGGVVNGGGSGGDASGSGGGGGSSSGGGNSGSGSDFARRMAEAKKRKREGGEASSSAAPRSAAPPLNPNADPLAPLPLVAETRQRLFTA